jgi:hypothetical protein
MKLDSKERAKLLKYAEEVHAIAKQLRTIAHLSEKGSVMVPSFVTDSFRRLAKLSYHMSEFCRDSIPGEHPIDISLPPARKKLGLDHVKPDNIQQPLEVDRKNVVAIPYIVEGEEV